jgi:hypothetical protein
MSEATFVTPQPDNEAAIKFLETFEPEGPWVLTGIPPDREGIRTRTFYPHSIPSLREWLAVRNRSANIYFRVNRLLGDLDKKAEREDINEVRWLHVDVAPRADEPVEEEQRRILSLMTERLPSDVVTPTAILFSGGGFQALWRLESPMPIAGQLGRAALYNLALEHAFQADNCHNIDRMMHLPGTVNIPDECKQLKGRRAALARVVAFNPSQCYPLSAFMRAAPI